jgi:intracellular septation protein
MKLFFDFLPIIVFFIVFKFYGIYVATAAAIAISFVQVASHWFKHHTVPGLQLLSLALIVILGGSTLWLHSEMFIKWKPTVLNWALAVVFLGSQLLSEKPFIQRLMESNIALPHALWRQLNLAWVIFFSVMGAINLFVIYNFSTNTWVNFKLFGMLGLTFLFAIIQAVYLARHIDSTPTQKSH